MWSPSIRIIEHKNYNFLLDLGYRESLWEGGYISSDGCTIITTHRDGHRRKIMQYRPNVEESHLANIEILKDNGLVEE